MTIRQQFHEVLAPLGNYYGTPLCRVIDEKYFFVLENWDCEHDVEISEEFYRAWCKEFDSTDEAASKAGEAEG